MRTESYYYYEHKTLIISNKNSLCTLVIVALIIFVSCLCFILESRKSFVDSGLDNSKTLDPDTKDDWRNRVSNPKLYILINV